MAQVATEAAESCISIAAPFRARGTQQKQTLRESRGQALGTFGFTREALFT